MNLKTTNPQIPNLNAIKKLLVANIVIDYLNTRLRVDIFKKVLFQHIGKYISDRWRCSHMVRTCSYHCSYAVKTIPFITWCGKTIHVL